MIRVEKTVNSAGSNASSTMDYCFRFSSDNNVAKVTNIQFVQVWGKNTVEYSCWKTWQHKIVQTLFKISEFFVAILIKHNKQLHIYLLALVDSSTHTKMAIEILPQRCSPHVSRSSLTKCLTDITFRKWLKNSKAAPNGFQKCLRKYFGHIRRRRRR